VICCVANFNTTTQGQFCVANLEITQSRPLSTKSPSERAEKGKIYCPQFLKLQFFYVRNFSLEESTVFKRLYFVEFDIFFYN